MNIIRSICLAALILCSIASCAQKRQHCYTLDEVVKKAVESIDTRDTTLYISLLEDNGTLISALKNNDPSATGDLEKLSDINSYRHYHVLSLQELFKNIDRVAPGSKMTFKSFKIAVKEPIDSKTTDYIVDVKVNINNEVREISLHIGKHKECYSIYPFINHYFNKG